MAKNKAERERDAARDDVSRQRRAVEAATKQTAREFGIRLPRKRSKFTEEGNRWRRGY
jgi:hypothetical protein